MTLVLAPDGTLYALTSPFGKGSSEFATINRTTGALTDIAPYTSGLNSLDFNSNGTLYSTTYNPSGPDGLYTRDPATGATAFIANLSGPASTDANQIRFIGNTLYTTDYTTPSSLYTIDVATGATTLVGNTGLDKNNGLGAVGNGNLVDTAAVNGGVQIFWIDPATGMATPGAGVNQFYVFTAAPASATPEPGSVMLVGCGMLGLYCGLRRRAAISR